MLCAIALCAHVFFCWSVRCLVQDPVTGLGTPDFAKLATLVKSLP